MQSNAHALWKDTFSRNTLWTNTLSRNTRWSLNVFLSLHPGHQMLSTAHKHFELDRCITVQCNASL